MHPVLYQTSKADLVQITDVILQITKPTKATSKQQAATEKTNLSGAQHADTKEKTKEA